MIFEVKRNRIEFIDLGYSGNLPLEHGQWDNGIMYTNGVI
jgi:hypothetical protein